MAHGRGCARSGASCSSRRRGDLPVMPTPAYPHDHSDDQESRRIDIDGKPYVYPISWRARHRDLPAAATAIPIGLSPEGLPVGVQIVARGWKTARR